MKKIIYILGIFLFIGIYSLAFPKNSAFANNPPDAGHSSLSASNQAPADGSSTINITVTLQDSSGNPVTGDTVNFSDSNDSAAVLNPSSTTLNSSGQASFTVTSTNAGTDNITVVDTTSNTTLTNLGQITFTSTATPTCTPVSVPQITNASSNDSSSVTITWTDSPNPVDHYVLAYGLSSGQYIYGDPNIGNQGTTSFTVGSLTSGTTYYFAIEASNSCSTSSYSNEESATVGGSPTPTSTPDTSNTASIDQNTQITDTASTPTQSPIESPTPTPAPSLTLAAKQKQHNNIFLYVIVVIVIFTFGFILYKWKFKNRWQKSRRLHHAPHTESGELNKIEEL